MPIRRFPAATRPDSVSPAHAVLGTPHPGTFPANLEVAYFGLGCFWGAERIFWQMPGVYTTAVGYMRWLHAESDLRRSVLRQDRSHRGGHGGLRSGSRVVRRLLKTFFEEHDPTQGMRQGNDWGTQYRSAIFTTSDEQAKTAREVAEQFEPKLKAAGFGGITSEIVPAGPFYYAEDYHQQYLHKVPNGYCGLAGTGVPARCPGRPSR